MASFVFNSNIFDGDGSHPMKYSGAPVRKMVYRSSGGDVVLFEETAQQSEATFVSSGTFTVPSGVSEVTVCMVGGGGGGFRMSGGFFNVSLGGGYAGTVVSQTVAVTPSENITVTVGSGGAGRSSGGSGGVGTSSFFGAIEATGGAAGYDGGFNGSSEEVTTCGGTGNNGASGGTGYHKGGQSSGFGNGGNGVYLGAAGNGGVGSGGGGSDVVSGAGGRGEVRITWSNFGATWSGSSLPATIDYGLDTSGSNYRARVAYVGNPAYGGFLSADSSGLAIGSSATSTGIFTVGFTSTETTLNTYHTVAGGAIADTVSFAIGSGFSGISIFDNGSIRVGLETSGGLLRADAFSSKGAWITLT